MYRETLTGEVMNRLEALGVFKNDEKLLCYARQYFHVQQTLFDSIYLYSLLKEDHYLESMPV